MCGDVVSDWYGRPPEVCAVRLGACEQDPQTPGQGGTKTLNVFEFLMADGEKMAARRSMVL